MELYELVWPKVAALPKTIPIVFPIAALEQHGHHMPVFTDSLLLGEVMRRVKEQIQGDCLFAPLQWLGNSHHHLDFPGTMSAEPRLYLDMLSGMVENFLPHGFQRFVFINGHGGNIVPAQQAMFELRQKIRARNDVLLLSSTYWTLGGDPTKANPALKQKQMGHACEWETSMMLRLRPDLVIEHEKTQPIEFGTPFTPATRAWITKDRTETGHIGDPSQATAEKGETIFTTFAADVVKLLERVIRWDGREWNA